MKILIIRFSSIGDIVLTTPVMRCLKQQLKAENPEIHYLIKKEFQQVLAPNPYIDVFHAYTKEAEKNTFAKLKAEQFDIVIDLQNNWRSLRLRKSLGIAKTYVFNKLNIRKFLLTQFKIDRMPDIHVVERYMDTTKALGVQYDGEGLDYFIPENNKIKVQDFLQENQNPALFKSYLAIAIGAAHGTKQIPPSLIAQVANSMAALGYGTVLLGGKGDLQIAENILSKTGNHVLNLAGQIALHSSADVLRNAWRVLAPDTGLMHISAALRCKMVTVWGSTVPAFGMTAFYPSNMPKASIIERKDVACRPCSKLGYPTCPKKHFNCMNLLESESIVNALLEA